MDGNCPSCGNISQKCLCHTWAATRRRRNSITRDSSAEERIVYLLQNLWEDIGGRYLHKGRGMPCGDEEIAYTLEEAFNRQYEMDGLLLDDWLTSQMARIN